MSFDGRTTLARADLADAALEGIVRAQRFATPRRMQATAPSLPLRAGPGGAAEQDDQLLFGETFAVLEVRDGFAWGQAQRDGYVGFVESGRLSPEMVTPTHWVSALRAYAFAEPSIKAPAAGPFSLNALVCIDAADGEFLHAVGAGWISARHLRPLGDFATDRVAVAERFLGAPYLWGGRDSLGLDCSGLVQQALYACGEACPRDTDMQETLGSPIAMDALRRGDLVFWNGHMGMMLDAETLLHANSFHMAVAREALSEAITRIAAGPMGAPTGFRRLPPLA